MNTCKPRGYWTLRRVSKQAKLYLTRSEFSERCGGAFIAAYRNGWMDSVCTHMAPPPLYPAGHWTKDNVIAVAVNCKTRTEFSNKFGGAYNAARNGDYLDEACSHMKTKKNLHGYWSKERVHEEAKKYNTRTEFSNAPGCAYGIAQQHGWLDDVCGHMISPHHPHGYWTKELVMAAAAKYDTRKEFSRKEPRAYNIFCERYNNESEFTTLIKPSGYWTKELVMAAAKRYKTRSEFKNGCSSAYGYAYINGWHFEACKHMDSPPSGFNYSKPAHVYLLKFNGFIKIGITNHISRRLQNLNKQIINGTTYIIEDIISWYFEKGSDAAGLETTILNKYKNHTYTFLLNTTFDGRTELLKNSTHDKITEYVRMNYETYWI